MSNLAQIQVLLQKTATSLAPLVTKTILAAAISPLTTAEWTSGLNQQATAVLTPADTDQGLEGNASADFWVIVLGITTGGSKIVYGAGALTIFNAVSQIPVPIAVTPSQNTQDNNGGNTMVVPTSNIHLETINIGGIARTSNIVVGIAGLGLGARVDLLLLAPGAPADIDIQIFVDSLAGANPFAFNTAGGTTRALFKFYFDGATLQPLEAINPPY